MSKKTVAVFIFFIVSFTSFSQNGDIDLLRNINPQHPKSGYWKFVSASTYAISAAVPAGLLAVGFVENNPALKRK
jgi:hypothetical protein